LTSTLTILCPQGIVMAADSVATKRNPHSNEIEEYIPDFQKIYKISKTNFGVSCWGLGKIGDKTMSEFLTQFEESSVSSTDTLDQVAEKLTTLLSTALPTNQYRMGLHLAGYVTNEDKRIPQLRHIFHETWHKDGQFVCENCHKESLAEGARIEFYNNVPYLALFNGDNTVANCLFIFIPAMTKHQQKIQPASLTIKECLELAEMVVGVAIQRLHYYVDTEYRKVPKTVGGKVVIAKITPSNGFEWVKNEIGAQ
jgi:hypothetical protein